MSIVKEIRESADVKLTKLGARGRFQAALEEDKDHGDRIKQNQHEVRQALDQVKAGIDRQKELSDSRKQAIHSLVDNLNAQLAASGSASRETLMHAREQIHEASHRIETELDGALAESKTRVDELLQTAINSYGQAVTNSIRRSKRRNSVSRLLGTRRMRQWTISDEKPRRRSQRCNGGWRKEKAIPGSDSPTSRPNCVANLSSWLRASRIY